MITKEKHFTKCETPNSSRIVEDKKQTARMPNGVQTAPNMDVAKTPVKPDETKQDKPNGIVDERADNSDDNISYNAPKFGTVIPNRIFVGGFSAKTADEELWRFFSSFSHITAAKIIYDRAGVSKCYGFVTFANPKDAKAIVKQYGGVMFSPMGRLRIAQAVRKQAPQFSPELSPVMGGESYYLPLPPQGPHKGPLCIAAYPMQPQAPMPPQQVPMSGQTMVRRESPRGSAATTPESGLVAVAPQQAPPAPAPHPAPARYPRQQPIYHQGQAMVAPQYMLYPQSMPGYDATGLYTTCPGYAQAMPPTYPYVMLHPRDYSAFHPSQLAPQMFHPAQPPQPTPCYLAPHQDASKMPVMNMNQYIY